MNSLITAKEKGHKSAGAAAAPYSDGLFPRTICGRGLRGAHVGRQNPCLLRLRINV
jgi:hypothetical protein